jgi:hypothetical protein
VTDFPLDLELAPGIISDEGSFSSEGRWIDCNNVRFVEGRPETLGGYQAGAVTGDPIRAIFSLPTSNSVYCATPQRLFKDTTDVSSSPLPTAAASWSLQAWGTSILLANPTGGKLYQQTGSGAATVVTQAPS